MTDYVPPLADMRFTLRAVAGLDEVLALPAFAELTPDLVDAVLEEAGRFASEVVAPLNRTGDREGARLENGVVRTAPGFREAYARFVEGGWGGAPFPPEVGGQGLPWAVSTALAEMWGSACLAFSLCPLLTQGAIELLEAHGSPEQKATFLEPMVSGRWTGTMNLTEPQAGSDVGALRTRAVPDGDRWRITGQKIFITWGDHDVAENVVHMVLARTPGAPEGIHGVSLFIVPKHLPEADGSPGVRNDVRVGSLEHKLGIHASPTCVMRFGDDGGAIGWMVGRENHGIRYMFTMMNSARLGVGLEGTSIAERAYQHARAYAALRLQGRDANSGEAGPVPIIRHPDVKRMLLTMKAAAEATRALAYYVGARQDVARRHPDPAVQAAAQARVDLLVPVVKAYSTDLGVEMASIGVQVHGGMGFIEETGAAQHYRDARIAPIYEGTNGIQAMDLVGRKLQRDQGAAMGALVAEIRAEAAALRAGGDEALDAIGRELEAGAAALDETTRWLLRAAAGDQGAVLAAASPYLRLVGAVTCAWLLARAAAAAAEARAAGEGDAALLEAKLVSARFFAEQMLPPAVALARPIRTGGRILAMVSDAML